MYTCVIIYDSLDFFNALSCPLGGHVFKSRRLPAHAGQCCDENSSVSTGTMRRIWDRRFRKQIVHSAGRSVQMTGRGDGPHNVRDA